MSEVLIEEAIQLVQSMYSKGVQSKDSRLSPRHIYSELLIARSTIIRQQANKRQPISKWVIQTIPCIELIPALPYECPCAPPMGKYILKTKYPIPSPIYSSSDSLIYSVTTLDGNIRIDPTEFSSVKYNPGKKYTTSKSGYYIKNNHGFITNTTKLKGITMEGAFDDPLAVQNFASLCGVCTECECKSAFEYDFCIDRNSLNGIAQIATNKLVILFGQMKEDKSSNASDDAGMETGRMIHQPQNQPLE